MPLAIFCNNPLSVSIVFERRAKYSGAIFKDSLHFQWWAGNFNFTFERVQHTFNENPAWSDIFLLNDITYKKILRYIFQVQSPNSRSHHVIRSRRSKRVVRNVVKTLFIVKREARENKEPTPHAPPPLCFEFFFWIANNLKKAILFCCTKQSDKSNNCYVVSFRNIERNLVSKLLDVGWEHSRSNKVLWGIGPAFWLENWGWMRGSWFWTGYCTFICKVQRGKRQCSAISIGQNILSLTSTQSMNYFELKRHWRGCDSTDGFGLFE